MKKLLIAAAALSVLGAAAPSFAQVLSDRADRLADRINTAEQLGDITYDQAVSLRARLHDTERLESAYRDDGMTTADVRDLDRRFDRISRDLAITRDDNQYRYRRDLDDDWRY